MVVGEKQGPPTSREDSLVVVEGTWKVRKPPTSRRDSLVVSLGGGGHMEAKETTNESRGLVGGGGGREVVERGWLVARGGWSWVGGGGGGGQEVHRQWSAVERWQRCWDNR